jgi:dipeptidyl aminopeptidase/acylaminoacyl peptidase
MIFYRANKIILAIFLLLTSTQLFAAQTNSQAAVKKIPLEDFFKNPQSVDYVISPDGKWLATLKPYKNRLNVFVQPADDLNTAPMRITSQTDRDIARIYWKGNDQILFTRDFGGDENYHIFIVDIKTQKTRDLTPFKGARAELLADLNQFDAENILIKLNKDDPKLFDVYRVNIKTSSLSLEIRNTKNFTDYTIDHHGQVRLGISSDGVNQKIYLLPGKAQNPVELISSNFKVALEPIGFSFEDENHIYMISNLNRDKSALVLYDIKKKKEISVLFQNDEFDMSGALISDFQKKLIGVHYTSWKREKKFFDESWQKSFDQLTALLPNQELSLVSYDFRETKFVIRAHSDKTLGVFYLYNRAENKLSKLEDISPWLNPEQMAAMKPISYKSRDGLTIHGYLTLPLGQEAKNLPVVINPHGGPWSRDVWRYSPEVQFLANRGYAVLQMNFRGSIGYGRKFWESSFKQWGKKMQDDVSDGVHWLTKEGIADAKRVCIYGGSYGGYSTLAGLAFSPELYKCGISYVGVANMFTFMNTIPPYWEPMRKMFYEMVGDPEKDKKLLRSVSPVFHADKIKAALMVAQGAKDPRVNKAESDQIVAAVKKQGNDVLYMVKEEEGHGFRNEENRFEFYRAMETFLNKHLQNGALSN